MNDVTLKKENKMLVTGSDGFLGTALCDRLSPAGDYEVIKFDINNGNIVDFDFSDCGAKHVVHLAAKTAVTQSWEQPYDYYLTNFMGTVNVLEYCRKNNASLTFVSTYMYGTPQYLPIDEKHPLEAHSVYNHTKQLGEDVCNYYSTHYNVPVTIFRIFNIYGGGQGNDFLIPTIIRQALVGNSIEVMDLRPKRDFVYIDDVIDAICLSIGNEGFNIYNVGSGVSHSVLDVVNNICLAIGEEKQIIDKKKIRYNEVLDVVADITKIKSELGWEPKTSFCDGIKMTVSSFKRGLSE